MRELIDQLNGNLSNQFLIAMPSIKDPVFAGSITYICEHTPEGALGLIINQPMDFSIGDIFRQMEIGEHSLFAPDMVLSGGPVQMDRGFVLHPRGKRWECTLEVSEDISLTASKDILEDLANNNGPEHAIVALGYAGWSAGQLEEEISNNSWLTIPAESRILFNTPCEMRWKAATETLGVNPYLVSQEAGHC